MGDFKGFPKGTRFVFDQQMRVIGTQPPPPQISIRAVTQDGSPAEGSLSIGEINRSWDAGKPELQFDLKAPALKNDQRGLLLTPPTKIEGTTLTIGGPLDPDELRLALLFWDHIESPTNNFIHQFLGSDADFLEEAGLLSRSRVTLTGSWQATEAMLKAYLDTFGRLQERDPARWSLARGERSLSVVEPELVEDQGLLLKLHEAIPIPTKDVPLEDVLAFREKRRPEMLSLRHHLERLYQEIIAAPDRDLAEATELSALDQALADHVKVARERKFQLRLTTLEARLNQGSVVGGAGAFAAAAMVGLPMVGALLAGAAGTVAASLNIGVGLKKREKSATPFEYVSRMHKEL